MATLSVLPLRRIYLAPERLNGFVVLRRGKRSGRVMGNLSLPTVAGSEVGDLQLANPFRLGEHSGHWHAGHHHCLPTH